MQGLSGEGWKSGGLLRGAGIPAPTGSMEVGCLDLMQRFRSGEESVLLVRLFYPTEHGLAGKYQYAKWFSHLKYAKSFAKFMRMKESGELAAVLERTLTPRTPALDFAPVAASGTTGGSLPLVIFSHGLSAMRTVYSGICCDLASHGFLVAAVEHGDESAGLCLRRVPSPDSDSYRDDWILFRELKEGEKEFPLRHRQLKQRSLEVQKALDLLSLLNEGGDSICNMMGGDYDLGQFKGRLKVDGAVLMGHSFGGATTIQALSEDDRFKCGIVMDCWMYPLHREFYESGVSQPLLFINSHTFQWADNIAKMVKLLRAPDKEGISGCQMLTIRGTNHFSQTDVLFIQPRLLSIFPSPLDPTVAHHINLDLCHAFLKRFFLLDHTHQQRVPNLDGGEGASDHIIFGTNVDWNEGNQCRPMENK